MSCPFHHTLKERVKRTRDRPLTQEMGGFVSAGVGVGGAGVNVGVGGTGVNVGVGSNGVNVGVGSGEI